MTLEPEPPAWIVIEAGVADREKPGGGEVMVTCALCETGPLVPVTVTVKLPLAEGVQERLEVTIAEGNIRLPRLRLQSKPAEGDIEEDRSTVPLNPFIAVTLIVEVPVLPTLMDAFDGLAVRPMSVTWNRAITVLNEGEPVAPVTATV